jgi:hypothetical protein
MNRFLKDNPDPQLRLRLAEWYGDHPDGIPADAVRDLELWHDPDDRDAQWLVWRCLPEVARQKLGPVW